MPAIAEILITITSLNGAVNIITVPATSEDVNSASLSWTVPQTRVNGSPLDFSQIAGYEVVYTRDDGQPQSIKLSDRDLTSVVLQNLTAGEYTYRVRAIDSNGLMSVFSASQGKTIDAPDI